MDGSPLEVDNFWDDVLIPNKIPNYLHIPSTVVSKFVGRGHIKDAFLIEGPNSPILPIIVKKLQSPNLPKKRSHLPTRNNQRIRKIFHLGLSLLQST